MFTSEEPTRFGIGCIGSRLLGGSMDAATAGALPDRLPETEPSAPQGLTLHDVRTSAGFTGSLDTVRLPAHYYHAWVELHIEQGPLLEREGIQIGIVTHIAAPASYRYEITGVGGHAGALLMPDRRDALMRRRRTHSLRRETTPSPPTPPRTASTPSPPSAPSPSTPAPSTPSPPASPSCSTSATPTSAAATASWPPSTPTSASSNPAAASRSQTSASTPTSPPISDPHIVSTLEAICAANAISYKKMVARAYHDTNFIAPIAPVAMLFIPCRNGVSHRPDEYATPESIALGIRVLALALAKLASE